jgi:hypothetical protein
MIIFFMIFSTLLFAGSPRSWEFARSIVDRHEFYTNSEDIREPANTWQSLFAVTYLDSSFQYFKDCIFYRVPGDEPGKIKIKTMAIDKDCVSEILSPGDMEMDGISHLRFKTDDNSASVEFQKNAKLESWKILPAKERKNPDPKPLMSSADFKSPRMIYLAPARNDSIKMTGLKDGTLCHNINQDCEEISKSSCDQCVNGWVEIPNGCLSGPKKCGASGCGGKDLPACRRGMAWQRKDKHFDCRVDSSFAWCSKGLAVFCDGDKAYCR